MITSGPLAEVSCVFSKKEISHTFEAVIEKIMESCHKLFGDHKVKVRSISWLNTGLRIKSSTFFWLEDLASHCTCEKCWSKSSRAWE